MGMQTDSVLCLHISRWAQYKGKTLSMFTGHALIVTLPPMLSNRLCHSKSPLRVKGDTTCTYDAGATFITGCRVGLGVQLLKQRTHYSTWHVSQLSTSFFGNSLLWCNSSGVLPITVLTMWFASVWRMRGSISSLHVPPIPSVRPSICFASILLRLWPTSSHSFPVSVFWMTAAVTPPDKLFPGKRTNPCGPAEPPASTSPGPAPPLAMS